ncbi:hypothetical protein [Microbacterium sp. NPDC080220]|uniref:hypothetical protein n=1 Tax=Microbacterium sp. NPDC080220 TaxID=3161017 RepID=UPI00344152DB
MAAEDQLKAAMAQMFGFDPDQIVEEARAKAQEAADAILAAFPEANTTQTIVLTQAMQSLQIAYLAVRIDHPMWPAKQIYEAVREVGLSAMGASEATS